MQKILLERIPKFGSLRKIGTYIARTLRFCKQKPQHIDSPLNQILVRTYSMKRSLSSSFSTAADSFWIHRGAQLVQTVNMRLLVRGVDRILYYCGYLVSVCLCVCDDDDSRTWLGDDDGDCARCGRLHRLDGSVLGGFGLLRQIIEF